MGRTVFLAVAAIGAALAVAGCGQATPATDSAAVRLVAQAPAAVEPTDGRLGDATAVRPDGPQRELSRGGRPDVRSHDKAPRRDGVGAGAACANPGLAPAAASLGAIDAATLCLLNGERADRGLAPLAPNAKLASAATAYAQDLVAGSYFSHTGRDGSGVLDRLQRSGYVPPDAGWALGENLAWGTGSLATPGAIMQAWMNSPGHRDNILNPDYREIGIGAVIGNPAQPDGLGATYATEFGVIEGVDDSDGADVANDDEPVVTKHRRAHRRTKKSRKRKRRHIRARDARHARHGGTGRARRLQGRRVTARGPKAHIAI
jgi:uncharacterized protein YkwD